MGTLWHRYATVPQLSELRFGVVCDGIAGLEGMNIVEHAGV